MIKRFALDVSMMSFLSVSLLGALAGCQRQAPDDVPAPVAAATAAAPAPSTSQAAAYQPPTAEQLFALVAPIALFPDRLVAQTLAASTHPDDVGQARDFLQQNRNLTGSALIDAADGQPWDPSVKSLVAFPAVLDQLANNTEWTAALGAAYASEPTDVMNAIQVMRGRARAHGNLQNSAQQTVQIDPRGPSDETVSEDNGIVAAPAQTILIEPAESDVVYVPDYDPDAVYGEPIVSRVYSNGWYEAPPDRGDLVATGLISFGAGVLVGQLFSSHEHHEAPRWGWNSWNTSWGGGRPGGPHYGRPAIVYDNHPYAVNRTTVINRTVNIDRSTHIDNRHDFNNGHNGNVVNNGSMGNAIDARRQAAPVANAQRPSPPDYAHMQRPNFTAGMTRPTAPNARPALPPPQAQAQAQRAAQEAQAQRPGNPAEARGANAGQTFRPGQPQAGQQAQQQAERERAQAQQHVAPQARPQAAAQPRPQPAVEPQRPQQQPQRPTQVERPAPQERPQRVEPPRAEPQRAEPQRQEPQRPQPQAQPQRPQPQREQPQREQQHPSPQARPQQQQQPQHENHAPPQKHDEPQPGHKHDDHGN